MDDSDPVTLSDTKIFCVRSLAETIYFQRPLVWTLLFTLGLMDMDCVAC